MRLRRGLRLLVLLTLSLLLGSGAGCSKGQPTPAPPPPAPERAKERTPAVESARLEVWVKEAGNVAHLGAVTLTGTTVAAPTSAFELLIQLAPWPAPAWFDQVRVEGVVADPHLAHEKERGMLHLAFPAGQAGDRIIVTLPDPVGLTYRLERQDLPRVQVEVLDGGGWASAWPPWHVYPAGPTQVRLTFDRPMNRAAVAERLTGGSVTWADGQTALVQLAEAPPLVQWNLVGVPDEHGLPLAGTIPALHFGERPYLVAIDPATGREQRLMDLPPQLTGGSLFNGGKQLMLSGWLLYRHPFGFGSAVTWATDTARQTSEPIQLGAAYRFFSADGLLRSLDADGGQTLQLSPDGRYVASLHAPLLAGAEPPNYRLPLDLVVRSPEGVYVTRIRRFMQIAAPPKDWPIRPTLVWSPDSRQVATLSDDLDGATIRVANVVAGVLDEVIELPDELGLRNPVPFHWNGERFMVGPHLVSRAGKVEATLPGGGMISPDSRWVLFREPLQGVFEPAWGELGLYSVATGAVRRVGEGLLLGWRSDGTALVVRWKDWRVLHRPEHP